MAISNENLNTLYKYIDEEVKPKQEEADLTNWSAWNKYVEDKQDAHGQGLGAVGVEGEYKIEYKLSAFPPTTKDDELNYGGDNFQPKGGWSVRVDDYLKAEKVAEDDDFLKKAVNIFEEKMARERSAKPASKEDKPKRVRYPAYKKDDRVNTPDGPGNVWSVDRDGTVCVELDNDSGILHEFEKKEIKKIK